jgi:hypothetical protein
LPLEGDEQEHFGFEGEDEMNQPENKSEGTPRKPSVNLVKLEPTAYTNILMI